MPRNCAAGCRARHDFGDAEQVTRQHVQQVLCEPPDRRRVQEQLMRIQVGAAVVAVAVVVVAGLHQDADFLERGGQE